MPKCWNHLSFVNVSPTLVIGTCLYCLAVRGAGAVLHSHSINAVMATIICPSNTFTLTHLEMIKVSKNCLFWKKVNLFLRKTEGFSKLSNSKHLLQKAFDPKTMCKKICYIRFSIGCCLCTYISLDATITSCLNNRKN